MSYPQAIIVHTTSAGGPAQGFDPSTGRTVPVIIVHQQQQQQHHVIRQGNERYKGDVGRNLGILQLCIGLTSLICGIIFTTWVDYFYLFAALWCGCVSTHFVWIDQMNKKQNEKRTGDISWAGTCIPSTGCPKKMLTPFDQ